LCRETVVVVTQMHVPHFAYDFCVRWLRLWIVLIILFYYQLNVWIHNGHKVFKHWCNFHYTVSQKMHSLYSSKL